MQEKSAGKGTGKVQKTRRASAVADNDDMSESESEESDEEMFGSGASRKGSAGPARKRLPRAAKGAWMLFDPFIIRIYLILAQKTARPPQRFSPCSRNRTTKTRDVRRERARVVCQAPV